ncbi:hypothetical protein FRC07_009310 [Ceratobasidium sp. 392]|nr:hypothetical protein FRC07_009310 [Ceratobasidium sp. 392]
MLRLNTLAVGAASVFALVAADHGHLLPRAHHHDIAERSEHHLQKRFGGRATYYQTGLGACGEYNDPSDKIVALNTAQFGDGYPGPHCFQMVNICAFGECHPGQIVDACPTCGHGDLDMSQSLFEQFASIDKGVFQMTWTFSDGGEPDKPDPPKTTKKPDPPETTEKPDPPKTSKKPEPEPTTTSKGHTTTSKPKPETTSTSSSKPSTTSTSEAESSTASQHPTSTVETSVVPSTTTSAGSGSGSGPSSGSTSGNWADLNQLMLAMGRLAAAAHDA